ncbi:MAG: hypothetical protein WCK49_01970 [Myxococcaceae bacterium]
MRLVLLFALFSLGACQKESSITIPSLSGKTLRGTVTSGTDSFTGLEGYQFSTQFISKTQFETKNAAGALESAGQYELIKNRLILQSDSGLHPKESLEVILKFIDAKSGVYEVHSLSGSPGEQTGIFTIQ